MGLMKRGLAPYEYTFQAKEERMAGGTYDFIVLGGGHNGLLSTIYLSKAGFKVACLEGLDEFGGGTRSEEFCPGYIADTGGMVHNMLSRTPIIRQDELELFSKYGLEYHYMESLCCSIFPDESHLIMYKDLDKTCEQIAQFSEKDAETYREFSQYMGKLAGVAAFGLGAPAPQYGMMMNALAASEFGREFLRLLNSSAQQIVEEWFESEEMRVTLTRWCTEMMIDPRAIGTSTLLSFTASLHQDANPGAPFPIGGCVNFVKALCDCARANGADLFTNQMVNKINIVDGEVKSVRTTAGDEFVAKEAVVSTINIKDVFDYMGEDAPKDEKHFVKILKNADFVALNQAFALNTVPHFKTGEEIKDTFCVEFAPEESKYLKAFSDFKFGEFTSEMPLITMPSLYDKTRCPEGHSVVNVYSYAPWNLHGDWRNWEKEGDALKDELWEFLKSRTDLTDDNLVGRWGKTPLEYSEWNPAFHNGDIAHIGLQPSQMFDMRPLPGKGHDYHGDIENLYFLGCCSHPGGGIAGNARIGIQKIFEDYDIDFKDVISR